MSRTALVNDAPLNLLMTSCRKRQTINDVISQSDRKVVGEKGGTDCEEGSKGPFLFGDKAPLFEIIDKGEKG